MRDTESYTIYVNQPQYIYNFNANFDSWSGSVNFNWDVNQNVVRKLVFEKSVDGGLQWEEVLMIELEQNADGYIKNNLSYYEYDEGNYVYRVKAFGELNEELHVMNSWGEIKVQFDQQQYEGEAKISHVNAWVDTYSSQVNLWWDAFGDFDTVIIEKSTDLENFTFLKELPRFAQSYNYLEEEDGHYYYRVTAIKDEVAVSEFMMMDSIRVKDGAVIGSVDGWIDFNTNVINLNWSVKTEEVKGILVERREVDVTEFELLGEFGNLKSSHEDQDLPAGTYVYRISATNELGTVIDSIETKEFEIVPPVLVYSINASFYYDTGRVEFYFSLDTELVKEIMIEKTTDGIIWEEVLREELVEQDGWVKQHTSYLEFGEGEFQYRLTGFDYNNVEVGTVETWEKIYISFEFLNLQEPTEIFNFDVNADIYNSQISMWWDAQGMFERYVVFKSTDGLVWEKVAELPRFSSSFNYQEMLDGNYFYKLEVKDSDGVTISELETPYTVRVKHDAVLGQIFVNQDWYNGELHVSWEMFNEDGAKIVLERRSANSEYEVIGEFDGFTKQYDDKDIYETGTYQYRVSVLDELDNLVDQLESYEAYIEAQTQIFHFNVNFNWGINDIRLNFGLNQFKVHSYIIEKSADGGLTWEVVFDEELESDEDHYKANLSYYEFEEGQYVYRMTGYNEEGISVGTIESCCEVVVQFDNMNLEGEPEIQDSNVYYNIWNNEVQLWWNSQGDYYGHLIEKSLDGVTWEEVISIPRFSSGYAYQEEVDGTYYYRVSAVDELGTVLVTKEANNVVRVKQDALIGNLNLYISWEGRVELYWDVIDEDIALIRVSRKLVEETEYTILGEYGHLKRSMFEDLTVDGTYIYLVTLLDEEGNVLDELESDVMEFNAPIE